MQLMSDNVFLYKQIIELASVEGISKDELWKHFSSVTIPAILRWQAGSNNGTEDTSMRSIGEIMLDVTSAVTHVSEVPIRPPLI